MKYIKYIISSHYFSIVISLILVSINIYYCYYIDSKITNKLDNFECIYNNPIEKKVEEINSVEPVNEDYTIFVDVKGEVKNPGVYEINNNSRVSDVIELSGGLTKNANTRFINLSKSLKDGDVVVIYSNTEIKNATKEKVKTVYVETPCVCEEVKNDACLIENLNLEEEFKNETKVEVNETINNKININTASISELTTLSGIGESKAKAIIDYRNNNGNFKSIEDIINVSGISESIYAKIKENITV